MLKCNKKVQPSITKELREQVRGREARSFRSPYDSFQRLLAVENHGDDIFVATVVLIIM